MSEVRPLRPDELTPIHEWWTNATDDDLLDVSGSEVQEIILDLFATIDMLAALNRAAVGQAALPQEVTP